MSSAEIRRKWVRDELPPGSLWEHRELGHVVTVLDIGMINNTLCDDQIVRLLRSGSKEASDGVFERFMETKGDLMEWLERYERLL